MVDDQYVWLIWSSAFIVPWLAIFAIARNQRKIMIWASLFTTPFGLTEPLFVPEYWNPPSLFDLAQNTGFDIESLIFCFGIGGIGAVFYNVITGRNREVALGAERHDRRHRFHFWALSAPFIAFPILYLLPFNPIYPAIAAMILGSVTTVLCRPDLGRKMWIGGFLFLAYYTVFLVGLEMTAPGYIARVWSLEALSGLTVGGAPIEELLFAIAFGAYWSGVYEHFTWRRIVAVQASGSGPSD